jgi:hypothetical protein
VTNGSVKRVPAGIPGIQELPAHGEAYPEEALIESPRLNVSSPVPDDRHPVLSAQHDDQRDEHAGYVSVSALAPCLVAGDE